VKGLEHLTEQRIEAPRETAEDLGPRQAWEFSSESIGTLRSCDRDEGVVELGEPEPQLFHAPGQPLVAVDIHLDGEGEPGLAPHMHETELRIQEVEVVNKAFTPVRAQSRSVLAVDDTEGLDGLDRPEHADEATAYSIAFGDLPRQIVLADPPVEVLVGSTRAFGRELGMALEPTRRVQSQLLEILELDPSQAQEVLQTSRIADRQMAFEDHAIEARQRSQDSVPMLHDKAVHGV
jgi:hypothetical protein